MPPSLATISKIQRKIKEAGHAFFQVDLGYIVHQHLRWLKLFPRIEPYFSVKCQPDTEVIRILSRLGVNFDCSSQAEIELVLKHVSIEDKRRIIFTNPFKFRKDMIFASKVGINLTSFDSIGELERLKLLWPQAKLMLRIAASNTKEQIRALSNTEKFGAQLHDVPILLESAQKMQFDVVGISFHAGIMCDDWTAWSKALKQSYMVKQVMDKYGFNVKIINIGGGFHGRSLITNEKMTKEENTFNNVCLELNKEIDEFYPSNEGYKIIATPGRHYVIGAYTLATQVIGKRLIQFENDSKDKYNLNTAHLHTSTLESAVDSLQLTQEMIPTANQTENFSNTEKGYLYILNDGVYGSFNVLMFSEYTFLLLGILDGEGVLKKYSFDTKRYKSKIYGPTCDTFDILFPQIKIPELMTEDWLIWADMGAYTNASRTDFNGIQSPKIFYNISQQDEQLLIETSMKKAKY